MGRTHLLATAVAALALVALVAGSLVRGRGLGRSPAASAVVSPAGDGEKAPGLDAPGEPPLELERPADGGVAWSTVPPRGSARIHRRDVDREGLGVEAVTLRATLQPPGIRELLTGSEEPTLSELSLVGDGRFQSQVATDVAAQMELRHSRPSVTIHLDAGPENVPCSVLVYPAGKVGDRPWVRPDMGPHAFAASLPHAITSTSSMVALDGGRYSGTLELEPGKQYFLVSKGAGYDPTPQLLKVPAVASSVDAHVGPPGVALTPRVAVEVTFAPLDAETLDALIPHRGSKKTHGDQHRPNGPFRVMFLDAETGVPICFKEWTGAPPERFDWRARPGKVRVVALSLAELGGYTRYYGRTEQVVDVGSAGVVEAKLELQLGGLLEVEIRGALSVSDRVGPVGGGATGPAAGPVTGLAPGQDPGRAYAALVLEDETAHQREEVHRLLPFEGCTSSNGDVYASEWPIGETHTSEVLSPGRFTLRATFPNRAPCVRQVTIRSGAKTKVYFDFGE